MLVGDVCVCEREELLLVARFTQYVSYSGTGQTYGQRLISPRSLLCNVLKRTREMKHVPYGRAHYLLC